MDVHAGTKDAQTPGVHPQQQQVVRKDQSLKHRVKRVQTTKNLFWFSKPTIFIMLYKLAYFQVSFALAYLLYKAILDKDKTAVVLDTNVLEGVTVAIKEVVPFFSGTVALLVLLGIVLLLIAHSAWVVLPLYCLCMTTSKDATKDVKKFMEALHSHEWSHQPASAYIAHEMTRAKTLQRLNSNWQPPVPEGHQAAQGPANMAFPAVASLSADVPHLPHSRSGPVDHEHL